MKGLRFLVYVALIVSSSSVLGDERSDLAKLAVVFQAAKEKLPRPLRDRLGDVTLVRERDLGVEAEAPLEYRLLSRAAYASFSTTSRNLTVYDAGLSGSPTWQGERVSRSDLATFLAGVADVLGVESPKDESDPALDLAWVEFVKRIWLWSGDAAPELIPEVGDGLVMTRFLKDGVRRAMGGEASMEQLMVHEFGHALQLEVDSLRVRMRYWASVSGTLNTDDGEPANGLVGAMNRMEEMMVLIRLLLAEDPEKVKRGTSAMFRSSSKARFVNRYARYDLREDYAESFRLMVYDPARLVKLSPEKFFYLNALGWNARLDRETPGPLWYSGDDLERLLPKSERAEMFERIFGVGEAGPAWHPAALAAVLRAHQSELHPSELPQPYPVVALPDDLPMTLQKALSPELSSVVIGGKTYSASEARQKHRQDELIVRWMNQYYYDYTIEQFRIKGTGGVLGSYRKMVGDEKNSDKRRQHFEVIRELGHGQLGEEQWKELYQAEAQFHKRAGNRWRAARYSILAAEGDADEKLEQIRKLGLKSEPSFECAAFLATAVDVALEAGDEDKVRAAIELIPGDTFGAWLRLRAGVRAAKSFGGKTGESFLNAAKKEAQSVQGPLLREHLEGLLE